MLVLKSCLYRYSKFRNEAQKEAFLEAIDRVKLFTGIDPEEMSPVAFVKVLIQDYVVLTR
jgi:hypothetical protein